MKKFVNMEDYTLINAVPLSVEKQIDGFVHELTKAGYAPRDIRMMYNLKYRFFAVKASLKDGTTGFLVVSKDGARTADLSDIA